MNKQAYDLGVKARQLGWGRTSPYYEEITRVDGRKYDLTEELNKAWFAGYDGAPREASDNG